MASNPTATGSGSSEVLSPRIRFTRTAKGGVVNHGYMSLEDAEGVYRDVLRHWGVRSSNEQDREEILTGLAEALLQGTSVERDYANVTFEHDGEDYSLDQLEYLAGQVTTQENPIRVWARSFRKGEMASRCAGLLSKPENTTLRDRAVYNYGCGLDMAPVCFDFADALIEYGWSLSFAERSFIRSARAMKTQDSHNRAQDRGGVKSITDGSGTLGGSSRDVAPVQPVQQDARSKFPSLR